MKFQAENIQTAPYTVTTPVYEGPLDLLLQLIERAELDITKLALAQVTDQFLSYMLLIEDRHPEQVSEFLMIASRLMQIKSEALLPRPPEREPGEEDPSQELIQQLLIYKRYKQLADFLNQREEAHLRTFLRSAPPPKVEGKLDLSNVSVQDLWQAANDALALIEKRMPIEEVVTVPRVTIREKISYITERLQKTGRATFSALLGDDYTRVDIVVTFLAMLELVKRFRITTRQETLFGEITIEQDEEWDVNDEFELEFLDG